MLYFGEDNVTSSVFAVFEILKDYFGGGCNASLHCSKLAVANGH